MSTKNRDLANAHKAAFRQRRRKGLQAMPKPWGWLSASEVKAIAVTAYNVASHGLLEDMQGGDLDEQELRQAFACNLAELVSDLVMAAAVTRGGCWPVTPETPPFRNYPQIAANLCADLPASWRPQYPIYMPCSLPRGIGGVAPDVAKRNGIKEVD
jgi:hypothetical protein